MLSNLERPVQNDQQLKLFELLKQEVLQRRSDVRRLRHEVSELHKRLKDVEDGLNVEVLDENSIEDDASIFGPIQKRLEELVSESKSEQIFTESPDPHISLDSSAHSLELHPDDPLSMPEQNTSIDAQPEEVDVPKVDSHKERLHEQLRQAELEMSLERARAFQEKAQLEEMRIKKQQQEGSSRDGGDGQDLDFETRWNRHLEHYRKKCRERDC
ncbi:MAG: hypothetical protein AAGA30_07370 [Planctomycetota bacterium]